MQGRSDLKEIGLFRSMGDPMQIVSGPIHQPIVHFEAPPVVEVPREMERYLNWFSTSQGTMPALARAATAHLYFESIHPFEDGNGRIGRALAELSLSQSLGKPVLLALSKTITKRKKLYYDQLAAASRTMEVTGWIRYFANLVLEAQDEASKLVTFIIGKPRFFDIFRDRLNPRQEKALARMFEAGPAGFKGGLSAGNYAAITKASSATTTRDLNELVKLGALNRTGEKRYARYFLPL